MVISSYDQIVKGDSNLIHSLTSTPCHTRVFDEEYRIHMLRGGSTLTYTCT
ncbi:hypothetical protein BVRB_7g162150 [Beta vulgaris subsp. vulgaris]|nr:hypothetical protein BVRB_7g162150 [Beta vulgaris subsp. vulgaris]